MKTTKKIAATILTAFIAAGLTIGAAGALSSCSAHADAEMLIAELSAMARAAELAQDGSRRQRERRTDGELRRGAKERGGGARRGEIRDDAAREARRAERHERMAKRRSLMLDESGGLISAEVLSARLEAAAAEGLVSEERKARLMAMRDLRESGEWQPGERRRAAQSGDGEWRGRGGDAARLGENGERGRPRMRRLMLDESGELISAEALSARLEAAAAEGLVSEEQKARLMAMRDLRESGEWQPGERRMARGEWRGRGDGAAHHGRGQGRRGGMRLQQQ